MDHRTTGPTPQLQVRGTKQRTSSRIHQQRLVPLTLLWCKEHLSDSQQRSSSQTKHRRTRLVETRRPTEPRSTTPHISQYQQYLQSPPRIFKSTKIKTGSRTKHSTEPNTLTN